MNSLVDSKSVIALLEALLSLQHVEVASATHLHLEDRIFRAVTSKRFRRTALDDSSVSDIKNKITSAVLYNEPISFSVPFGGYKGWQQPFAPGVNWAEVFWLDYLRAYGAGIAAVYQPGVTFSLTYFSGVLDWLNGLPTAAQRAYINELEQLLLHFSSARVRFELVDLTLLAGGKQTLLKLLSSLESEPSNSLSSQHKLSDEKINSAARNIYFPDAMFHAGEMSALAINAAKRCELLETLAVRRNFNKYGKHIQLTHIKGASLALHMGSCVTSISQPWVSSGILEYHNGVLKPRIINLNSVQSTLLWHDLDLNGFSGFAGLKQIAIKIFDGVK